MTFYLIGHRHRQQAHRGLLGGRYRPVSSPGSLAFAREIGLPSISVSVFGDRGPTRRKRVDSRVRDFLGSRVGSCRTLRASEHPRCI